MNSTNVHELLDWLLDGENLPTINHASFCVVVPDDCRIMCTSGQPRGLKQPHSINAQLLSLKVSNYSIYQCLEIHPDMGANDLACVPVERLVNL